MDTYTLGVLLKSLLESQGVRGTAVILVVVGFFYLAWKALSLAAGFFNRLIEARDKEREAFIQQLNQLVDRTMLRSDNQDQSSAAFQNHTVKVLEAMEKNLESMNLEIRSSRELQHLNQAELLKHHQELAKDLAHLKGKWVNGS